MDGSPIIPVDLRSACTEITESLVSSTEVYETTSNKCESVVTLRTATLGSAGPGSSETKVAYHDFSLDVVETTPLSCCLAAEDFPENKNACIEDTVYLREYTFD